MTQKIWKKKIEKKTAKKLPIMMKNNKTQKTGHLNILTNMQTLEMCWYLDISFATK